MTKKEVEIIKLMAEDNKSDSIARILDISIETVKTHRKTIMRKMEAATSAGMVMSALRKGIIDL